MNVLAASTNGTKHLLDIMYDVSHPNRWNNSNYQYATLSRELLVFCGLFMTHDSNETGFNGTDQADGGGGCGMWWL